MTNSRTIVEWAPFELAEGVDEQALLNASDQLQTQFVNQQKGFIRRELLKGENGQWVDLILWESRENAEQVVKNAEQSTACRSFFQLMENADPDDAGSGIKHFELIKSYK